MAKSRALIIEAAKSCFFQHGYNAANVSMVSRYASISRVTIHKQFGSKEELFRAVIEQHLTAEIELARRIADNKQDIWQCLEDILIALAKPLFTEINDQIVLNDLVFSGRLYCEDIIKKHRQRLLTLITELLLYGVTDQQLTLTTMNVSCEQLGEVIEHNFSGLLVSITRMDLIELIKLNITTYRQATLLHL